MITVTHGGASYECAIAVKCTYDGYIKLYDENGVELVAFNGITDFSDYTISGGSFSDPCACAMPISLSAYAIGGRKIKATDWILADNGSYYYEIESDLISGNENTCNIMLHFAAGTELYYTAEQEENKVILRVSAAPLYDVTIDNIHVTRA